MRDGFVGAIEVGLRWESELGRFGGWVRVDFETWGAFWGWCGRASKVT